MKPKKRSKAPVKRAMKKRIKEVQTVDPVLLAKQIRAFLKLDIDEDLKSGLHNLLGEILDQLKEDGIAVVIDYRKK